MEVTITAPGRRETIEIPETLAADLRRNYGPEFLKEPWAMVEIATFELARLNDQLNEVAASDHDVVDEDVGVLLEELRA